MERPLRADDEARTRDLNLGKVALYQLSYVRLFLRGFPANDRNSSPCPRPRQIQVSWAFRGCERSARRVLSGSVHRALQ